MKPELKDYLYSINQSKKDIMGDDTEAISAYPPYVINKCLSGHMDAVMYANEMNKRHQLSKKMQYDFLINTLKPRKRFSPWLKKQSLEHLELVKEYYGYNDDKALDALKILTVDQLDNIRQTLYKGGMK
jgi:hypothetical protein